MAIAVRTPTLRLVATDGEISEELDNLQGTWTTEQYIRITNRSRRLIEYTDGKLEVLPIPTKRHQAISRFLLRLLLAYLEPHGGTVFYSPLRLQVRERKFREPDLIVALDEDDPRLQDAYFLGADMVLEIVSPDDPERDTVVKRADYAGAFIPEYWIVNPLDETITVLQLEGEEYAEHGVFQRGETATSPLLKGFAVDVGEVLDAR